MYHDPDFQEPWCLLVSPDTEYCLPTEVVVDLYRQRMYIELTFRDWKTHLGIRGLRLEMALTVAYILAALLGSGPAAG